MKITDTLRRLGLLLAATGACATAGLATTGCRKASPTLVDCTNVTSTIQYPGLTTTSGPALGSFVADAQAGVALTVAAPKLQLDSADYPAACVEHPTFTSTALPDGLALDATTGAITGTPTQPGLYTFDISVTTSGTIGGSVRSTRMAVEVEPATTLFSGWDAPRILPGTTGQVTWQGASLAYLDAGTTALELRLSGDTGITWTLVSPPVSPPARTGFHTATDELGHLYVAGGTAGSTALDDLWMFDGTAWTELAAHTPFPSGSVLVASGGHLFAVDGAGEAWRSDDHGLTWTAVTALWSAAAQPDLHPVCAFDLAGVPVVVAEALAASSGTPPQDTLWRSSDAGATWASSSPSATDPFASLGGVQGCTAFSGQAVLAGEGLYTNGRHDILASTDLSAWSYQPHRFEWSGTLPVEGLVALAGKLYFAENGLLYPDLPLP